MKRVLLCVLMLGAVLIVASTRTLTAPSAQAGAPQSCPALPVRVTGLEVNPQQAAQQHLVTVTWAVSSPECFKIQRSEIKGKLTFANGQSKPFAQSVSGSQTSFQFQVPGLLPAVGLPSASQAPVKAEAGVTVTATAPVAGDSSPPCTECDVPTTVTSCLPLAHVLNVRAVFAGLLVSPENPAGTHFPKVKVSWQVSVPPPCYNIEALAVTVKMRTTTGLLTKTVTVPGNQSAVEIVFDNSPVPANFTPGLILASVRASGTARITGNAQKELQLNP